MGKTILFGFLIIVCWIVGFISGFSYKKENLVDIIASFFATAFIATAIFAVVSS